MALTLVRHRSTLNRTAFSYFIATDPKLYWQNFPKRVRVEFNGATIADSRRVKALHETGNLTVLYFPRDDIDMRLLEATEHHTENPCKGTASYWSVRVGDRVAENAV